MGSIVLVTGGVRSGKSAWALSKAEESRLFPRTFVAPAEAADPEMRERVRAHRAQRGESWRTVEEPLDLAAHGHQFGGSEGDYSGWLWRKYVKTTGRYWLQLNDDPGVDRLTIYETDKLAAVYGKYGKLDFWGLSKLTHGFPEWLKYKPSKGEMDVISLEDLIEAVCGEELRTAVLENLRDDAALDNLLRSGTYD